LWDVVSCRSQLTDKHFRRQFSPHLPTLATQLPGLVSRPIRPCWSVPNDRATTADPPARVVSTRHSTDSVNMPHPRAYVAMAHIIAVAALFAGGLPAVSPDPHGAAEVEPRSSGVVQAAIHSVNYPMVPNVPSVAANRDTLALPLCPTCQGCQKWPSGCRNADKSDVSIRFLLLADWGGTGGAPFCTPTETDTAAAMAMCVLSSSHSLLIALSHAVTQPVNHLAMWHCRPTDEQPRSLAALQSRNHTARQLHGHATTKLTS